MSLPLSYFTNWLASGERGVSSEAIVTALTGVQVGRQWGADHPYDPADFRRCQLLLRSHPLAELQFRDVMRDASPTWGRLIDAWDDIHAAIEDECPGYIDNPQQRHASKGYALMTEARSADA